MVLTANEVAQLINRSMPTARRLLIQGKIKGEKVGRDWVVKREDVNVYLLSKGVKNVT